MAFDFGIISSALNVVGDVVGGFLQNSVARTNERIAKIQSGDQAKLLEAQNINNQVAFLGDARKSESTFIIVAFVVAILLIMVLLITKKKR